MECRLCGSQCEKQDPQFQKLCRTCGQKRETYIASAIGPILQKIFSDAEKNTGSDPKVRRETMINTMIGFAEDVIKKERSPQ